MAPSAAFAASSIRIDGNQSPGGSRREGNRAPPYDGLPSPSACCFGSFLFVGVWRRRNGVDGLGSPSYGLWRVRGRRTWKSIVRGVEEWGRRTWKSIVRGVEEWGRRTWKSIVRAVEGWRSTDLEVHHTGCGGLEVDGLGSPSYGVWRNGVDGLGSPSCLGAVRARWLRAGPGCCDGRHTRRVDDPRISRSCRSADR